jgi:hypothetical protein
MILDVQGQGAATDDGLLAGRILRWCNVELHGKRQGVCVCVCLLALLPLLIKSLVFSYGGSTVMTLSKDI